MGDWLSLKDEGPFAPVTAGAIGCGGQAVRAHRDKLRAIIRFGKADDSVNCSSWIGNKETARPNGPF